jgi:hypothetical protein
MTVRLRRAHGPAVLGVCCALAAGCSGPTLVPVRGTLTKGDQPVADVMIQFAPEEAGPEAKVAYGHTDASGGFVLKTLPHGDGAAPGTYRVTLQPGDGTPAMRLVPGKLRDLGQTPWRVTVPPAGLGELKLDMTQDTVAGATAK